MLGTPSRSEVKKNVLPSGDSHGSRSLALVLRSVSGMRATNGSVVDRRQATNRSEVPTIAPPSGGAPASDCAAASDRAPPSARDPASPRHPASPASPARPAGNNNGAAE